MKWVTREGAKTDRVACPWLIKKFIDPGAEFLFVPKERVLEVTRREGGKSFDTPGADYTHRGHQCSFEVLIEEHRLKDPALLELAQIVHGADIEADWNTVPEAAGLKAIAEGFHLSCPDDHEKLRLEFPMYDALYAWCQARLRQIH
ncbi:MAG: chromate resistance protein ChrB domain-containing protein [Candidatus Methylomirabilales bacterium]